jgi:hypothetical protein
MNSPGQPNGMSQMQSGGIAPNGRRNGQGANGSGAPPSMVPTPLNASGQGGMNPVTGWSGGQFSGEAYPQAGFVQPRGWGNARQFVPSYGSSCYGPGNFGCGSSLPILTIALGAVAGGFAQHHFSAKKGWILGAVGGAVLGYLIGNSTDL